MLESIRIDVYARRSASRCARELWNKPGRNSRSPDFVLELSPKLWFRSFVTFRDSSLEYLLQTSSTKIYRQIKAVAVSDSIHVFFHYDRRYSGSPGNNPSIRRSKYLGTRVRRPLILSFHSDLRDPVFVLNHSQLFLTDDILRGEFFCLISVAHTT